MEPHLINELEAKHLDPDDPVFELVPKDFDDMIKVLYQLLPVQLHIVNHKTLWPIFHVLLNEFLLLAEQRTDRLEHILTNMQQSLDRREAAEKEKRERPPVLLGVEPRHPRDVLGSIQEEDDDNDLEAELLVDDGADDIRELADFCDEDPSEDVEYERLVAYFTSDDEE